MKSPPPERPLPPRPYVVPNQQERQQLGRPRAVDDAPSPQLMQRTTSGGQIPFPQQVNPTQFVAGPSQVVIRMPRGPSFNNNFATRRQPAVSFILR